MGEVDGKRGFVKLAVKEVGGGMVNAEERIDGEEILEERGWKCEALCGECKQWVKLGKRGGRGGRANSWWRHAFKVCVVCVSCFSILWWRGWTGVSVEVEGRCG